MRDCFVAMNIHGEVDAAFVHGIADREHFGRPVRARIVPFAIEIGANGIGAQMPARRPIGIAIRHNVQLALAPQNARNRIGGICQALNSAFHPPFGHALARMLTGIEPHLRFAFAHLQAVYRLPVERVAEAAISNAFARRGFGYEVVMPLHRIGCEIGEPGDAGRESIADRSECRFPRPCRRNCRRAPNSRGPQKRRRDILANRPDMQSHSSQ